MQITENENRTHKKKKHKSKNSWGEVASLRQSQLCVSFSWHFLSLLRFCWICSSTFYPLYITVIISSSLFEHARTHSVAFFFTLTSFVVLLIGSFHVHHAISSVHWLTIASLISNTRKFASFFSGLIGTYGFSLNAFSNQHNSVIFHLSSVLLSYRSPTAST